MALGVGWKDAAPISPPPLQTEQRPPIGVRLGGVTIVRILPDGGRKVPWERWLPGLYRTTNWSPWQSTTRVVSGRTSSAMSFRLIKVSTVCWRKRRRGRAP